MDPAQEPAARALPSEEGGAKTNSAIPSILIGRLGCRRSVPLAADGTSTKWVESMPPDASARTQGQDAHALKRAKESADAFLGAKQRLAGHAWEVLLRASSV